MSSTFTQSSKRQDEFTSAVTGFFETLHQNTRALIAGAIAIAVLIAIGGVFLTHSSARSEQARDALFEAQKAMDTELKAIASAEAPKADTAKKPQAKSAKGTQDAKKDASQKDAKEEPNPESVAFRTFDVDAKLPESLKKLGLVDQEYGGTRAAFEARLLTGDLYLNHGEPQKSIAWYEKAVSSAPKSFDKALALSALGYAHENSGQYSEAIQVFQKALNLGEAGVKGDLLLATARCYELLKDSAKAKSAYDQILKDLPDTEYAKTAQYLKSKLD